MENAELGFGAVDACQEAIGISCDQCIYADVCLDEREAAIIRCQTNMGCTCDYCPHEDACPGV